MAGPYATDRWRLVGNRYFEIDGIDTIDKVKGLVAWDTDYSWRPAAWPVDRVVVMPHTEAARELLLELLREL